MWKFDMSEGIFPVRMFRTRSVLAISAFLAVTAWANAQAMACCWVPDALSSVRAEIAEIAESSTSAEPMAADHSCCPGAKSTEDTESSETATSGATMPGCGMDARGVTSLCCESSETAAVSAKVGTALDGDAGTILLTEFRFGAVSAPESPPWPVLSSPPDGAPPFLSFQRLLI